MGTPKASEGASSFDAPPHPIAARIPAEPGWRAVVFVRQGEELFVKVSPIAHWAMKAPIVEPPKPAPVMVMSFIRNMTDAFHPIQGAPTLWPLDESGALIDPALLHRLVPPCDQTNEQLAEDAHRWCEAVAEADAKMKPKTEVAP